MAYPKGAPKPKGSGRRAGTPNKRRSIEDVCIAAGVDPFAVMAELAATIDPDKLKYKFQAAKELAEYLESKKKSIEHSTDPEKGFRVIIEEYKKKE